MVCAGGIWQKRPSMALYAAFVASPPFPLLFHYDSYAHYNPRFKCSFERITFLISTMQWAWRINPCNSWVWYRAHFAFVTLNIAVENIQHATHRFSVSTLPPSVTKAKGAVTHPVIPQSVWIVKNGWVGVNVFKQERKKQFILIWNFLRSQLV